MLRLRAVAVVRRASLLREFRGTSTAVSEPGCVSVPTNGMGAAGLSGIVRQAVAIRKLEVGRAQ
ncbi:MAG: hypothetical protein BGN99_16570 [Alphaproteobacteria bacterium 65-37]|nr:MAG: hypothetical protein BGN99_16570 [Alphaproteobacteria bacterium 65-37]